VRKINVSESAKIPGGTNVIKNMSSFRRPKTVRTVAIRNLQLSIMRATNVVVVPKAMSGKAIAPSQPLF
jgi:hypothetical protein